MKVQSADLVNNVGPNTMEAMFRESAKSARTLQAVVAFATEAGVNAVLPYILQIAQRGHASITVGLYQGITEPAALRALAKARKAMSGSLTINVATSPNLHRKVYIFRHPTHTLLLIGSSNLSSEGLASPGECNVLLRVPGSPNFRAFIPELVDSSDATRPLTQDLISKYELSRRKPRSAVKPGAIRKLLKSKPPQSNTPRRPKVEPSWFRFGVVGTLKPRTDQILEQQTNWDRNGWEWCTVDQVDYVSKGDYALIFDFRNKPAWAEVVTVKGVTRTALPTPDGRCFFAYAANPTLFRKRKLTKAFWTAMADAGWALSRKDSRCQGKLSKSAIRATLTLFRR